MNQIHSDPAEVEDHLHEGFCGKVAFDVGGHIGESLYWMTKQFKTVLSLEPAHESFRIMKDGWGDHPGVILRMEAAGDYNGELETSMRENQMAGGQLVSVGMPYKRYIPGITPLTQTLPWGREIGIRTVQCHTLDWYANEYTIPNFVKVDVEGHDAQVLRGATEILKQGITSWLIEFHTKDNFDECMRILNASGYTPEIIRHPHYEPGSALWNGHGWLRAFSPDID